MEFLLSDYPWILAVLYAAEYVSCDIVHSYTTAYYRNVVIDSSSESLVSSNSSFEHIAVTPRISFGRPILGMSLLLVTGYWDVVPRSVFPVVVGMTVVSCGCTLLLDNLPALYYWRVLFKKGLHQDRPEWQPWSTRAKVWEIGCAALFGLCWLLTGNLIFIGVIISKLLRSMTATDIAD